MIESAAAFDMATLFWAAEAIALAAIGGYALHRWRAGRVDMPVVSAQTQDPKLRTVRARAGRAGQGAAVHDNGGPGRRAVLEEQARLLPTQDPASLNPIELYDSMALDRGMETTRPARGEIERLFESTRNPGPRQVHRLVDQLGARVENRLAAAESAEPAAPGEDKKPDAATPAKRQPLRRPLLRRRRLRHLLTITPTDVKAVTPDYLAAERAAEAEAEVEALTFDRPIPQPRFASAPAAPRPR